MNQSSEKLSIPRDQGGQKYPKVTGKSTVHPRTNHDCPEGDLRCSCTLFLTSALDGGGNLKPRPGRFTAGKNLVPIV